MELKHFRNNGNYPCRQGEDDEDVLLLLVFLRCVRVCVCVRNLYLDNMKKNKTNKNNSVAFFSMHQVLVCIL